jgi:hypothetical protein
MERLLLQQPWDANLRLRHARACERSGQINRAIISGLQALLLDPHARLPK